MKIRKIVFIVCTIVVLNVLTVHATPLENQLKEYDKNIEKNETKLATYELREQEILTNIREIDSKIESAILRKSVLEEQINGIDKIIAESDNKILEYENEIENRKIKKDAFLRNMYKNGQSSYLDVVFNSDNIFDILHNLNAYEKLIEHSKSNIEKLNETMTFLEEEKTEKLDNKKELQDAKISSNAVLREMEELSSDQKVHLQALKNVRVYLQDKIDQEKIAVDNIIAQIEAEKIARENANKIQEEQVNLYQSSPSIDVPSSEIIEYATNFLGIPYVWGGEDPTGFDCSGLVEYVYTHFGYTDIPRVSEDQQNYGMDVSIDNLQPGDLVFYGRPAYHVAFYVRDNYILHAPNTGDVVKIESINLNNITSAKRIVN
ncbi:C40 family peptidase [Clostridium tertium]|uniref:C40 family peptidase n=1 Tax=Clostridium tertium TaxID=1559 RepID=UPI0023B35076|nr:C40 family peptidase [Clostridium tertium]